MYPGAWAIGARVHSRLRWGRTRYTLGWLLILYIRLRGAAASSCDATPHERAHCHGCPNTRLWYLSESNLTQEKPICSVIETWRETLPGRVRHVDHDESGRGIGQFSRRSRIQQIVAEADTVVTER